MPASMLPNQVNSVSQSLLQQLMDQVEFKLRGRIREFHVLFSNGGLVLIGCAKSYYAKQLAQHFVMEMTELPISANDIRVQ
jgi:hypothetical protein